LALSGEHGARKRFEARRIELLFLINLDIYFKKLYVPQEDAFGGVVVELGV
jgi:hypothetical protein